MNRSNEDKIKIIEGQMKLCSRISIAACAVTVLLILTEFLLAGHFKGASWAGTVVNVFTYIFYIMPFVIVIPLFVRTNLNVRRHNLQWQDDQKKG